MKHDVGVGCPRRRAAFLPVVLSCTSPDCTGAETVRKHAVAPWNGDCCLQLALTPLVTCRLGCVWWMVSRVDYGSYFW